MVLTENLFHRKREVETVSPQCVLLINRQGSKAGGLFFSSKNLITDSNKSNQYNSVLEKPLHDKKMKQKREQHDAAL